MLKLFFTLTLTFFASAVFSQNVGIVRKNYFSTIYDSTLNISYDIFDSATVRLGAIDPLTGIVTNLNNTAYPISINLTGATIDPYQNHYYISSGFNLLTLI